MSETATKEKGRVARLMGQTVEPTGFKAVISKNIDGVYNAVVEISLVTTAWIASGAPTRRQFLADVYQSIADEYGVTGFTPEFVDEEGRAIVDGLDDLASDVLEEDRYCQSNGCDRKLRPGELIYCKECSEEINV